ncbi:MAG: polysaccharide biosynthesis protein [Actinobacteria bacterium]|nr:polysaccharide biosynthesis protein [Actinomycetota bacterium]
MKDHYGNKVIYSFAALLIINLLQFLLVPIISIGLGVEVYGIWSQIQAAVNFLLPLALLSLPEAFTRFTAAEKDKSVVATNYYTVLFTVVTVGVVIALIFYLLAPIISETFIKTEFSTIRLFQTASFLIIAQTINKHSLGYFRTFQDEKLYSAILVIQNLVLILAAIILINYNYGLKEIILSLIIVYSVVYILTQVLIIKDIGFKLPDIRILKPLLLFSLPLLPMGFFNIINNISDRYIIGYYLPVMEVAKYSAGYSLVMVVQFLYAPFFLFLFPKTTNLWESKDFHTMNKVMNYSNKLPLFVAIPVVFASGLLYKEFLLLITGQILDISFLLIPVICVGYIFLFIGEIYAYVLITAKVTNYIMKGYIIASTINIVGNIILVPIIGIIGAALITLLTFFVQMLYFIIKSNKYYKLQLDWKFLWKSIISAVFMIICIYFLKQELWGIDNSILLLIMTIVGALIYILTSFLFGVINKDEILLVKSLILFKLLKNQ